MMALCATCVNKIYSGVIDDVITGVREFFLDEGLDEQVLSELRQLWEQKLQHMNVFANCEPGTASSHQSQGQVQQQQQQVQQQQQQQAQQQQQQQVQQQQQQQTQQTTGASPAVVANLVPVQITVPPQQAGGVPKAITIHVPSNALANGVAGMQLQAILSSPTAAHTFALEASRAAEIIQRKLNQALEENGIALPPQLQQYNQVASTQVDGPVDEPLGTNTVSCSSSSLQAEAVHPHTVTADRRIMDAIIYQRLKATQVDGQFGTGDSSSEISDDDDDDDDDKDEEDDKKSIDGEEDEDEAEGPEEEPLNSDDDVSEDDTSDMFDTDNVVVCQYDKITRVRNKWKFILKDGIMNLKGKDYLFQKASGEGEW